MISFSLSALFLGVFPIQSFAAELEPTQELGESGKQPEQEVGEETEGGQTPETGSEGEEGTTVPETENPELEVPEVTPEKPEIPEKPEVEVPVEPQKPIEPEVPEKPSETVVEKSSNESQAPQALPAFSYGINLETESFIAAIAPQAQIVADEHDLYASVMIAQAILESGSGNSQLSQAPNNNIFGIKGSYQGKSVVFNTQEDDGKGNLYTIQDSFRKYETWKESLEDYAFLLKGGVNNNNAFYKGAWKSQTTSYQEATAFLTGRYATDSYYNLKLNGLIETYDLTRFDEVKGDKEIAKKQAEVTAVATSYLGVPYVWGGTTPEGFDCSGLVQYSYQKALELELARVTTGQETQGVEVSFDELQTGDLLFFGPRGNTEHVAIYLTDGYYIHAPQPGETVKVTRMIDYVPSFVRRMIQ